jgi:hypothetical protein
MSAGRCSRWAAIAFDVMGVISATGENLRRRNAPRDRSPGIHYYSPRTATGIGVATVRQHDDTTFDHAAMDLHP